MYLHQFLKGTIKICKSASYTINGFSIEAAPTCTADALVIAGTSYCGYADTPSDKDDSWTFTAQGNGNVPPVWTSTIEADDTIQFISDESDNYQGFELCLEADAAPTSFPPQKAENAGLSDGAIAGIVVGSVIGAGAVGYVIYDRYGEYRKKGAAALTKIGDLVF